jgi:hypothetical protein
MKKYANMVSLFVKNHNVMKNNIDIEAALDAATNLSGVIEHLGSVHAALAAKDNYGREHAALAATFSVLLTQAERLMELLTQ